MQQPKIGELDIDSVVWQKGGFRDPATRAIKAMRPGQAITITHDGYRPDQCGKGKGETCNLRSRISQVAKRERPDARFSFKHLPDGRLGVACFTKEE